jgi:hypothetical protein
MANGYQSDVFLRRNKVDKLRVCKLAERLKEAGLTGRFETARAILSSLLTIAASSPASTWLQTVA